MTQSLWEQAATNLESLSNLTSFCILSLESLEQRNSKKCLSTVHTIWVEPLLLLFSEHYSTLPFGASASTQCMFHSGILFTFAKKKSTQTHVPSWTSMWKDTYLSHVIGTKVQSIMKFPRWEPFPLLEAVICSRHLFTSLGLKPWVAC